MVILVAIRFFKIGFIQLNWIGDFLPKFVWTHQAMPWQMITSDDTDKFRVGLHIYIYWASEMDEIRYPMASYKDGDSVFLYDRSKLINTAIINRVFKLDEFTQRKREAGITSYVELTFIDGNKWFCTEPEQSDPFGGVFLCRVIHDEWVLRAQL